VIASPDASLALDLLAVDEGAAGRAEIDQVDLLVLDLDDRVHATDRLVVDPEVGGRDLADLDHALGQHVLADQLAMLEDPKRQRELGVGHGKSSSWRARARRLPVPR
jgi:hypothetical protein